jgi:hypothetical protein
LQLNSFLHSHDRMAPILVQNCPAKMTCILSMKNWTVATTRARTLKNIAMEHNQVRCWLVLTCSEQPRRKLPWFFREISVPHHLTAFLVA